MTISSFLFTSFCTNHEPLTKLNSNKFQSKFFCPSFEVSNVSLKFRISEYWNIFYLYSNLQWNNELIILNEIYNILKILKITKKSLKRYCNNKTKKRSICWNINRKLPLSPWLSKKMEYKKNQEILSTLSILKRT